MQYTMVSIQRAADAKAVASLLTACGLPASDIESARAIEFFGVREGATLRAVVGLELYGSAGLLRSLAVSPSRRGQGWARELVAYAERYAPSRGVQTLYLLTTTAAGFFEKLGYARTSRADVPAAIQATSEYSHLCPASSVCLSKSLTRR
jgi:amino-acid N-acetyltransferase